MPPTLVLMLKAPTAGAVKTRLAATVGAAVAARIYQSLVERQVRALPATWPVTIHYAPRKSGPEMRRWLDPLRTGLRYTPQSAGDLGIRLATAVRTEIAQGAETVIVIGGDCPALDETVLRTAHRALTTVDVVLGPAADGGYYLIGLKQPRADLFTGIAWSTPEVLVQTRAKIRAAALTFAELPLLDDVDDEAGWRLAVEAGLIPP